MEVCFTTEPIPRFKITVQRDIPGLCLTVITGEGPRRIQFTNVYGTEEQALRRADDCVQSAVESWGTVAQPIELKWHTASA